MRQLLSLLILVWFTTLVFAEDSTKPKVYTIDDHLTLVPTLKFQYDRPRIVVKALYPQLESTTPDETVETFNQLVTDLVQQTITEYKQQVAEQTQALKTKTAHKNDLYLDFDSSLIRSGKQSILSVRFSVQGYLPGIVHSFHRHFVLNYDLVNNERIDLADLFIDGADYLNILAHYTGVAPTPSNFTNWNIKPNGLLITLDPQQTSSHIYGAQTILIPYATLKMIIDPDAPIAHCVANKKTCLRGNLLTGGFIDTAHNSRAIDTRHRLFNPALSKL